MRSFPRHMEVWDDPDVKWDRIVLYVANNDMAVCVSNQSESSYIKGEQFDCDVWLHYEALDVEQPVVQRIISTPTKRPMTRNEMLGFLASTSRIVVRTGTNEWQLPHGLSSNIDLIAHQWATIDADGNIGEPQEFEK